MPRSDALIKAQKAYDAKRPPAVGVRFNGEELERLQRAARPGESVGQTVKRLALSEAARAIRK